MSFSVSERLQNYLPSVPASVAYIAGSMGSLTNLFWPSTLRSLWSSVLINYQQTFSNVAVLFFSPRKPKPEEILNYIYLRQPGDKGTFWYDESLPPLPLPPLHDTLQAYVESCKPHLSEEELKELETTLEEFEKGIGADLQARLQERAASTGNWLEKWWEEEVYLKSRQSLVPWNQMCSVEQEPKQRVDDFDFHTITRRIHFVIDFWRQLRRERIKPQLQAGKNGGEPRPFTMHQYPRFFNTCRIPKEGMDMLVNYFNTEDEAKDCPSHIVVLYRGFLYSMSAADQETGEIASPGDLERSLRWVLNDARSRSPDYGPGIATLTCDDRDSWAANRQYLISLDPRNAELLHQVESALIGWTMRDEMPEDESDLYRKLMTGAGFRDWWADKPFAPFQFRNGLNGSVSDHTPMDGMVNASINHYVLLSAATLGSKWAEDKQSKYVWTQPTRLDFVVDKKIEEEIIRIRCDGDRLPAMIDCKARHFHDFGKAALKIYRTHPDAFVQAAIQLAYFRLHRKPGSTYETASTRKFYHGRTETCRSCTPAMAKFVEMLDDTTIDGQTKWKLLKEALDSHQKLMHRAQDGFGCDRHLFGLQMIARELGMDHPLLEEVFGPGPFTKSGGNGNFVLSTSLLGYATLTGGTVPMCPGGYGFFYSIEDDVIHHSVSNYTGSDTDSGKYAETFEQSLRDMKLLAETYYRSS